MNPKIMVCITDDPTWTHEALQQACMTARRLQAEVVLVQMMHVQHLSWLGTDLGYVRYNDSEVRMYTQTAEDYGVVITWLPFQYYALVSAIGDAAEYVEATLVYATLPPTALKFWRSLQLKRLTSRLSHQHRQLCTLDQTEIAIETPPSVSAYS